MTEGLLSAIQRAREYDWRPAIPILAVFALFVLFMPARGAPPLSSLEPHQKAISLVSLPTVFASIYWFGKANGLNETPTPEERVLDDTEQ